MKTTIERVLGKIIAVERAGYSRLGNPRYRVVLVEDGSSTPQFLLTAPNHGFHDLAGSKYLNSGVLAEIKRTPSGRTALVALTVVLGNAVQA